MVRPDVITALGQLARGGSSMDSRANACRAIGILRGRAALPDLIDALRSKDNNVMYESLVAMQKIRNPDAGPKITYLLRDLDDRIQTTAIETAGLLRSPDALPALRSIVGNPRNYQSRARGAGGSCHDARVAGSRPVPAGAELRKTKNCAGGGGRSGPHRESIG